MLAAGTEVKSKQSTATNPNPSPAIPGVFRDWDWDWRLATHGLKEMRPSVSFR